MSNKTKPIRKQPSNFFEPPPKREWTTGLCDCSQDVKGCCLTVFCPLCYPCVLSKRSGENCCLPLCLPFAWLVAIRTKIRSEERINGTILKDCCISMFCGSCATCQLKRELDYFDNNPLFDLRTV